MDLLPDELRRSVPSLYSCEGQKDPTVVIKYFSPFSSWTWYVIEGSPEEDDFVFFGFVVGFEGEWGYFTLSQLEEVKGPHGLGIERDLHFTPKPISQIPEIASTRG